MSLRTRTSIFDTLLLAPWLALAGIGAAGCSDAPVTGPDAGNGLVDAGAAPDAMQRTDGGVFGPLGPGVSTLAGSDEPGSMDGPREVARFRNPTNVIVGPDSHIYVADYGNDRIRRVTPDGEVSLLTHQPGFIRPFGMAFTPDGTLYVQTDGNDMGQVSVETGSIWRVDLDTGEATLVARDLGRPRGLAALSDGRLVLVDHPTHAIHLLDPEAPNPERQLLAGKPGQMGFVDAAGEDARFARPLGAVVIDDAIYVADRENHRIRKITLQGAVTTLAGTGTAASVDGPLAQAQLHGPFALARDSAGNLYASELGSMQIRKIDLASGMVTTIAGTGTAGFLDAEDPLEAQFFGLEGVAVDGEGTYLYIADGNRGQEPPELYPYHRVRRLELP